MGKLETWSGRYLEDFTVGDVYQHQYGRTVIDADSLWFSAISMSANEQYFNRAYAEARGGSDLEVNPAFVMALAHGGGDFYGGWMKNKKTAMISCNDGFRPVSFLLEALDEDAE